MNTDFETDIDFRSWSALAAAWEREDRAAHQRVRTATRVLAHVNQTGVSDLQRQRESGRRGQALGRAAMAARRAQA